MSDEPEPAPAEEPAVPDLSVPEPQAEDEPDPNSTVGTGSYIAISCTVLALIVTFLLLGILFLLRWL